MNTTEAQKVNNTSTWHHEQIKAAIRMRGMTLRQLAIDNGRNPTSLSLVFARPSPFAEKIIADFLGVPLHELWPERWTADGRRIRPRYAHKYITQAA